ncbi:MAG: flagellar biosynthesis protein FlhB [Steroidobacteraceae bacterium]
MAEQENEDRTERASPKRLEDARKKGQVPRSRELNAAAVTLAGGTALYMMGGALASRMHSLMGSTLAISRDAAMDESVMVPALEGAFLDALQACAPILGVIVLAAILAPLAMGSMTFSTSALMPDFSRLNPLTGIGRMFSVNSVMELTKAIAKFGVVGLVAVLVLWNDTSMLIGLGREPIPLAISHAFTLSGKALLLMSASLILIAGVDVPFQLWSHAKQLRMSKQELRDEHKEQEGSPELKNRIRSMQQEVARGRMMHEVPKASVVITNPTHFAVALRYDEDRMRAPVVVAKGADHVAAKIRELAAEHGVPLFEAPPLARTLFRHVDIGGEIPAKLYAAVAQVLTYVYQLQDARRAGAKPPVPPAVEAVMPEGEY